MKEILEKFGMADCRSVGIPMAVGSPLTKQLSPTSQAELDATKDLPYRQALGSIMYTMCMTRPDLSYAVSALSQFASNPGIAHWNAVQHVFRYLKGTTGMKLVYPRVHDSATPILVGFSDSDWGNNRDDRRSVTGYVFTLNGTAISWSTRKQPTVALSSTEAEYMASTQATKEAIWLRLAMTDLGFPITGPTIIHVDNQGALALSKNPEHHDRTKHIDIQHHFVRERVTLGEVDLAYIPTDAQTADVLTKALVRDKHSLHCTAMGLRASGGVGVRD